MNIRSILKRPNDKFSLNDLEVLSKILHQDLSPWPWTPGYVLKPKSQIDVEFMAKSPEIVNYLINFIVYLTTPSIEEGDSSNDRNQ